MTQVSVQTLAAIDDLQARYIHALDTRNFRAWADTFVTDADAAYICTSAENDEAGWPIALMLDDCRDRIEDRITFIEKIWVGTFQDYRTRHFVQRTHVEEGADGLVIAHTNFSILYTPEDGHTAVQVAGAYRDEIVLDGPEAQFKTKRAVYDTTVLPRYIVYPF